MQSAATLRFIFLEICSRIIEIQLFDPDIAVADVVTLALEFDAAGGVGDAFSAIVAAVQAGVLATPYLMDGDFLVNFRAIEIHADLRLLRRFPIRETGGAEHDVTGVPFAGILVFRVG